MDQIEKEREREREREQANIKTVIGVRGCGLGGLGLREKDLQGSIEIIIGV